MGGERDKHQEFIEKELARQKERARLAYDAFEGHRNAATSYSSRGVDNFLRTLSDVGHYTEDPQLLKLFGGVMVKIAVAPAADELSAELRTLIDPVKRDKGKIEEIGLIASYQASKNVGSKQNYFSVPTHGQQRGRKYLNHWIEHLRPRH